jgi:hypothetical protein
MQENGVDEAEIASMKKDINDALGSGSEYHDQGRHWITGSVS